MPTSIYVLKCENDKYYVGKTNRPIDQRIEEHADDLYGSAWTSRHKPIKVVEVISNASPFDEDKYTKIYMNKYGIENVRGGSYAQVELDDEQVNSIRRELNSSSDKCHRCNRTGHFVQDCYARTTVDGKRIDDSDDSDARTHTNRYNARTHTNRCYRCGREGHYSNECYARTHADGSTYFH